VNNVWFLRMDKYEHANSDFDPELGLIRSEHGSCDAKGTALEHKDSLFPLLLSGEEVTELVLDIKKKLIEDGSFDFDEPGKRRCDVAIRYWISVMKIGDLVVIRAKNNKVFICEISSYISESFFLDRCCFERTVTKIKELSESMVSKELWKRTQSRKTIERNAKPYISNMVRDVFEQLHNK
jgi:hypothetical protein